MNNMNLILRMNLSPNNYWDRKDPNLFFVSLSLINLKHQFQMIGDLIHSHWKFFKAAIFFIDIDVDNELGW